MCSKTVTPVRCIETPRLILVPPQAQHLDAYVAYCASDRARFVGGPYDGVKAFEKFCSMAGHWTLRGFGRYVITLRQNGQAIGHVGAMQIDATALPEMTWTLWADFAEGHGYAFEAAAAYLAQARQSVGISEMLIRIDKDNLRSHRLADRLGALHAPDHPAPDWMPDVVTYTITLTGPS